MLPSKRNSIKLISGNFQSGVCCHFDGVLIYLSELLKCQVNFLDLATGLAMDEHNNLVSYFHSTELPLEKDCYSRRPAHSADTVNSHHSSPHSVSSSDVNQGGYGYTWAHMVSPF